MVRTLLVANRSEIARRVFRTCRAMGIRTVAVFSEPDRASPFVDEADEAFALGGASPAESYLRIDRLLEAARVTGADAVHPGYGFLAENPGFAREVVSAGLTWVGPTPESMEIMGSKLASKQLAAQAGVPTLPSVEVDGLDEEAVARAGDRCGYPLLVKASAGGGGKGMRVVDEPAHLVGSVESARREASAAFGDGTVFLEPYHHGARHVEVQVLGDAHGTVTHLFERECSIQRRHQKVVEECPSPAVDAELRDRLTEGAVAVARAVGYRGVGTVEFLLHDQGFAFLEMNTRLQVEHTVTEAVTGLDLVRLQILVAAGLPLPEEALSASIAGHAIEARLYAEDPLDGYLPTTGRIDRFRVPTAPGLRVDSGVEDGSVVTADYDALLAKVVAWAPTRAEAAGRLAWALERAQIHTAGATNRDLLAAVLREADFLAGDIDTDYLDRHDPAELGRSRVPRSETALAALAAALAAQALRTRRRRVMPSIPSGWRNNPSGLQSTTFTAPTGELDVGYRFDARGGCLVAEVGGQELSGVVIDACTPGHVTLTVDDHRRRFAVHRVGDVHHVDAPSGYVRLVEHPRFPASAATDDAGSLHAPMPGRIVAVHVDVGDAVEAGAVVVVLEAMKMEHTLRAPRKGTVSAVHAALGDQVDGGAVLVVITEPTGT